MTATWELDSQQFIENAKQVAKNNAVMAVVKNNAYNFGLEFAIDSFTKAGITTFSTTSLRDAVFIRQLAPDAVIFLMNPTTEFDALRKNDIQMTLPSLEFYYQYKNQLCQVKVHLEYENLLHRSGFKTFDEMKQVIADNEKQKPSKQMEITGIWTHFGYADEFDVEDYYVEKKAWLDGLDEMLKLTTFDFIHAQNSASYVRDDLLPDHTHARLGIVLYGCRPYRQLDQDLSVQSLKVSAHVIQIRHLNTGESAGYSFSYTARKPVTMAVVDIGYGDGVLRTRSKFDCLINGKRYNILALMMSHLLVEVDEKVQAGDEVILYSNDIRIDEFTFKGVGANSEQLSALNHSSLKRIIN